MFKAFDLKSKWKELLFPVLTAGFCLCIFMAIDFSSWGSASARKKIQLQSQDSIAQESRTYNNLGKAFKAMFYHDLKIGPNNSKP